MYKTRHFTWEYVAYPDAFYRESGPEGYYSIKADGVEVKRMEDRGFGDWKHVEEWIREQEALDRLYSQDE